MAEAGPAGQRPPIAFSATYTAGGRDASTRGDCLKGTGTRLKRSANGAGACAIGNGRVYTPER
ncbi:hypothetical protein H1235_11230 [Pseudoxanthomonas sp. NC8]|nr:hypothetical protein H1235_11230 [Pseudoxanthomonas sp. NC8]